MANYISKDLLRNLRNDIPIKEVISNVLKIPNKVSEGYFRFLCPICNEFHTAINKRTNLARCFSCNKNFNPIDIVMICKNLNFLNTVNFLKTILKNYK